MVNIHFILFRFSFALQFILEDDTIITQQSNACLPASSHIALIDSSCAFNIRTIPTSLSSSCHICINSFDGQEIRKSINFRGIIKYFQNGVVSIFDSCFLYNASAKNFAFLLNAHQITGFTGIIKLNVSSDDTFQIQSDILFNGSSCISLNNFIGYTGSFCGSNIVISE
jgi:hypothetical protein